MMSNTYWIVAHFDDRLGTNWTGVDEDRAVYAIGSFRWSDVRYLPTPTFYTWLENTRDFQAHYPLLVVDHDDNNRFVEFVRDPRSREPWHLDRHHDEVIRRWQTMMVPYGTLNAQAMSHTWRCRPPNDWPKESRAWAQYEGRIDEFEARGGLMLGEPISSGHGASYEPTTTVSPVLNDSALAERLEMVADNIRAFKPDERNTFLREAAHRLKGKS